MSKFRVDGVEDSGILRLLRGYPKHRFGYQELIRPIPSLEDFFISHRVPAGSRKKGMRGTPISGNRGVRTVSQSVKSTYMQRYGDSVLLTAGPTELCNQGQIR